MIRRGIARGEFREVAVDEAVQVLTSSMVMLSLWAHSYGVCAARPFDAVASIEALLDLALHALAVPAEAAPQRQGRAKRGC